MNTSTKRRSAPRPRGGSTAQVSISQTPASRRQTSGPAPEQLRRLKEQVTMLTVENSELKDRLRVLRKAAAPTTKLVKTPTTFTDVKPPERRDTVRLPRLGTSSKREIVVDLEPEVRRLKVLVESMQQSHADRLDSLESQLADKIAKAKESSADINRLQALVQDLQAQVGGSGDESKVRGLEATIRYLKEQLVGAQGGAATCAHIAKVNEDQAREARAQVEASKSRVRESNRLAKEAVDAAERQRALNERERVVWKEKETALQSTLQNMKTAWTTREAGWQAYNAKRNDQWKKDAAEWMRTAQSKLTDLQNGADLLEQISQTVENHGSGGRGKDSAVPRAPSRDFQPPYV
eukprot:m.308381 g.308381  ORF g.308381 m.308381 type:complete len:350 (-) comp27405_c0_seq3:668-1717(-)